MTNMNSEKSETVAQFLNQFFNGMCLWEQIGNFLNIVREPFRHAQFHQHYTVSHFSTERKPAQSDRFNIVKWNPIQRVHKYADVQELTPYMLRELIQAVYVSAPDKSSGKRVQNIHISYDLVGFIPVDELMKKESA